MTRSCARSAARPAARPVRRRGALAAAPRAGAPGVPPAEPVPAAARLADRARSTAAVDRASQAPPLSTFDGDGRLRRCSRWRWSGWSRAPGAPPASTDEKRAVLTDEVVTARRAAGRAPRRRSRRAGSRRRWSTASARSRCARSSAAGSTDTARRHRPRGRGRPRPGVRRDGRPGAPAAPGCSTRCCTATGRPPASRPRPCWPSTTTWWSADDAPRSAPHRPHRPAGFVRRHRSTLLIGLALVAAVAWPIVLGHRHRRPRRRWTRTTRAPTARRRWPGCSATRASTCTVARERRRARRRSTSTAARRWWSCCRSYLGTSTIDRLRDHTARRARLVVVGAGPGITDAFGIAERPCGVVPLDDGRRGRLRRPDASTGSRSRSTSPRVYPDGDGCFDGKDGALVAEPRRRAGAASAPTRRSPTTRSCAPTTPPSRCGCSGQDDRLVWYVPSARRPHRRRRRQPGDPAAATGSGPALWLLAIAMVT